MIHWEPKFSRVMWPAIAFVVLAVVAGWLMATRETTPDELVPVPPSKSEFR